MRHGVSMLVVLLIVGAASAQPVGVSPDSSGLVTATVRRRVVKQFDFDETPLGNYSSVPMNWRPILNRTGFFRHNEPAFDRAVGSPAPPSFHLSFDRGSVGARYRAKDISVYPQSRYRITARIRPFRLRHARAYVTAFFYDHALRKIEASEQRSRPVRGFGTDEGWTQVEVVLSGRFEQARWIGLTCMVEQDPPPSASPDDPRPIHLQDVDGAAWFDAMTVLRLPDARLRVTTPGVGEPGNVFTGQETIDLSARVGDADGLGLTASLSVVDERGYAVLVYDVPIVARNGDAAVFRASGLGPGRYEARLVVRAGARELMSRHQTFVRLAGMSKTASGVGHAFGVILDASAWRHVAVTKRLVQLLASGAAKVPVWHSGTTDEMIVNGDPLGDDLLAALSTDGRELVAVLERPPPSLAEAHAPGSRSLLDILTSNPTGWTPYLGLLIARYGSRIRTWQVGADGRSDHEDERQLASALRNVRAEVSPLVRSPNLAVPTSLEQSHRADQLPADTFSITIPAKIPSQRIADMFSSVAPSGTIRRWAVVDRLDPQRYVRETRLSEFARRIVAARAAGAETVFIHQPWSNGASVDGDPRPHDEFAVFRLLAQSLDGLSRITPVWLDHDVTAYLFSAPRAGQGTLVAWTDGEESAPRRVTSVLGPNVRRIGLGKTSPVQRAGGTWAFELDTMPAILTPVVPWRVEMQAGFALDESALPPRVGQQHRTLLLRNTRQVRLHGTLHLEPPPGCRIRPKRLAVDLEPGRSLSAVVTFEIPTNYAIGQYRLLGHMMIDGDPVIELTLGAALRVDSPELDVQVLANVEGDGLHIVQRISNVSSHNMRLRAYVIAPRRPRDTQLVADLPPGQSAIREFDIAHAGDLRGESVRVTAEQVDGPAIHNHILRFDQ